MTKTQKTNKINSISNPLLLVSILLIAASIIIKDSNAIRPMLWILGLIVFAINLKKNTSYTKSKIVVISLILLFSSIIVDGIISYSFKRIPVFTYSITQKDNTIVYNSLGIRAWQCNKEDYDNIIVDPFYKNGYMCNAKDIETIDINTFLNTIVQNHSEYKNRYVKIKGKISKKSGVNSLEMKPYTQTDTQVNGYVEFADNIILKIIFKDEKLNLDSYDIYDEITIIGIVKNMESNQSNHVIYMSDCELLSNLNITEFTMTTSKEKKCSKTQTLLYNNNDYNLYKYCLNEVIVTFPDGQYELSSALSSNKLQLSSLYDNYLSVEENDKSKLYKLNDYSILICDTTTNKDIFIGPSNMKFKNIDCNKLVTK